MNDKPKIIIGLVIFLAVFTFPFWYNHGAASTAPKPELTEKAKAAKKCILEKEQMRTGHMQLLNEWRNTVVRNDQHVYEIGGRQYVASLSNTCLDCHSNKAEFCDKCHLYTSAEPYCWTCHIEPKEKK